MKIKTLFFRILVGIFSMVLIFVLPFVGLKYDDDLSYIYGVFVGSKSKYNGIIEIWNIDSFEGGSTKKTNYISSVAKIFQKQNKGLYILIRNLTENECENLLKSGELPDLFSCSYGVSKKIKDYVQPFSSTENIFVLENFLKAGEYDGKLYGLAWCSGMYFLFSTKSKLLNAGLSEEEIENVKLSEIALKLSYSVKKKNSTKIINSLTFGSNKYLMPLESLKSYNNSGEFISFENSIDENTNSQSQYSAYVNFLAEKSVVLLGTQRDYIRLKSREKNGKIENLIVEPLFSFSDLVQFLFISKNNNELKREYAESFAKMLSQNTYQKMLASVSMFPVTKQVDFFEKDSIMSDITLENIGSLRVNNIF